MFTITEFKDLQKKKFLTKIIKIGSSYGFIIPIKTVRYNDIKKGDRVLFEVLDKSK